MPYRVHDSLLHLLTPVDSLRPHPDNPKNGDVDAIADSMRANGVYRPVFAQQSTGRILAGNHTYAAMLADGHDAVPVVWLDVDDNEARRILLADNRTADLGRYDDSLLLAALHATDTLAGTGYSPEDLAALEAALAGPGTPQPGDDTDRPNLSDRFLIPPFSVLDARQGWWRERKQQWLALGIRSEVGRDAAAYKGQDSLNTITGQRTNPGGATPQNLHGDDAARYGRTRTLAQGLQAYRAEDGSLAYREMPSTAAVSIFDPVLCEIAYRWFCPPHGRVLDCYAGGSVRGIVAATLGLHYTGIDLRLEQVEANRQQATDLLGGLLDADRPVWHHGDSTDVLDRLAQQITDGTHQPYDLLFTCPPYYDLEVYSDDPADLSQMDPTDFSTTYAQHLADAYRCLAPDAFAVYVVGSARHRNGALQDLRALTVYAAQAAGFHLASDAVLITPAGSLPVRAGRQFTATRVLGRTHHDVLVFYKGDRKAAAARLGTVDVTDALATITTEDT